MIIDPVKDKSNVHGILETLRQGWENDIRTHSYSAANAYHLGLLIGITEDQASAGSWNKYTHDSLQSGRTIVTNDFSIVGLDYGLSDNAIRLSEHFSAGQRNTYNAVLSYRTFYYNTINMSGVVE